LPSRDNQSDDQHLLTAHMRLNDEYAAHWCSAG